MTPTTHQPSECSIPDCYCHHASRQDAPLVQLPLVHEPLRSLTAAHIERTAMNNHPLIPSRRQYFEGLLSDDADFHSVPLLLRAVADWMDEHGVYDSEFDGLLLAWEFVGENERSYPSAVLLYRLQDDDGAGR